MKIELPLQFFLVCFLILGLSVFAGALYLQKVEPFQNAPTITAADNDIQLQACPSGTSSYSDKGDIYCCNGDIVNEKCNGNTTCSVSLEKPGMPSCTNLLRQQLREKSVRFCPPSLKNYFENKQQKTSGCTNGNRSKDGTAPLRSDQVKCKIYSSYSDNKNKLDSCDNIKAKDLYKCPQGKKAYLTAPRNDKPVLVTCGFTSNTTPQPITCFSDESYLEFLKSVMGDWKGKLSKESKLAFCSNAQRYYLERSLNDDDLTYIDGPYRTLPQRTKCIFNARMYADKYPDLKKAFGYNDTRLKRHYIDNGIRENREYRAGCRFDPIKYADNNPDLKRSFGYDRVKLLNHYKRFGINQNRVFAQI